jgi:hypothetical protein
MTRLGSWEGEGADVLRREVRVFDEVGDEGEVW